ncbi:MAG: hypothetical protein K6E87_06455 [bacterium]|nr:hypothetical protein [bacterium]
MKKISKMFIGLLAISSLFACGKKTDTKSTTITTQTTTEETKYKLELTKNIADAGVVTGGNSYKEGSQVTIGATANTGYSFLGWYNGEQELTKEASYSLTMPSSNLKYEAKFSVNKYTITIDNQVAGVTIDGITSGEEYDYNSVIDLTTTNVAAGTTIKWTRSDNVSFVGNNYSFNVPAEDITITLTSLPYEIDGNIIKLGYYPQTKEIDNSVIQTLNEMAGTIPTTTDDYNWTNYGYYYVNSTSTKQDKLMWYIDLDTDGDGKNDYRGVYIRKYRTDSVNDLDSTTFFSNQDDNNFTKGNVYWFKYELIEWNILEENNNNYKLISKLALDSQYISASGNEYYGSYLENFLNNDFLNISFTTSEKDCLVELGINDDLVTILTKNEVEKYYPVITDRVCSATSYAKSQNAKVSSSGNVWVFTRTPLGSNNKSVYMVRYNGEISDMYAVMTCYTIRPVIILSK